MRFIHHEDYVPLMKQQFVLTHRYTVLQETEELDRSSVDQHLSMLCFYEHIRTRNFFVGTTF